MSDFVEGLRQLPGSRVFSRVFRALLIAVTSLSGLLFFPYYPYQPLAMIVAGVLILSLKYPTAALAIGLLLSAPAAYYQNTFFGVIYVLLCIFLVASTKTWPALLLAVMGWVLALSPFSFLAFVPVMVCGLVLGSKEAAKIGAVVAISLFFLGWARGMTNLGLIVIPYAIAQSVGSQPIPNPWLPLSFFYSAKAPEASVSGQMTATLLRNFVEDMTSYIEIACWSAAGYVTGFVAGKWRRAYPWAVASAVGFIPVAGAYAFGASLFFVQTAGFESMFGLISCMVAALILQFVRSDLLRVAALHKARMSDTTAIAQPILEKQAARPELAWNQIGGYEQLKQEISDSVLVPLQKSDVTRAYGVEPPRGLLLFGPPGCGKTLMMKALAQTLKANFYYVKTSDIVSKWYGESEKRVTEVFSLARSTAPSVLFFDEIDSIAKKRDLYGSDDTTPRLLSLMLAEMDGLEKEDAPLLIVGATNKPDMLDQAILRPGRFDRVIYVSPPDRKARESIFRVHLEGKPLAEDLDFAKLAAMSERFSGADIRNVIQITAVELAKKAMKGGTLPPVTMKELADVMATYKPSIALQTLEDYERLRLDFERRVSRTEEELKPSVTFADIGGLDKVKQLLMETIELPFKHPELMAKYGLESPKGILLFGPPGCGKTLLARAAAGSLNIAFLTVSGAELAQKSEKDAAVAVREIFYRARENTPSMIFIDEIESLASSRGATSSSETKSVSQLLIEMDGMKDLRDVVVLAATNKPQWIDAALLRPGRFDKVIYIPPPDTDARRAIFRVCVGKSPSLALDYDKLAESTSGFSGADISAIVKESKMTAVRDSLRGMRHDEITMQDLSDVIKRARPSITKESLQECQKFLETYGERT